MITLVPEIARLPLSFAALQKHRKLHPAPFEKIFKKDNAQYRYYGQELCSCIGEYLLAKMPLHQTDWVMFIALKNDDVLSPIYGLHVSNNAVVQEKISTFDALLTDFDYPLNQSSVIYIHSNHTPEHLLTIFASKIKSSELSLDFIPPQYNLKPLSKLNAKHVLAISVLGLCGVGALFSLTNVDSPAPKTQIDPWEAWVFNYTAQTPAAPLLKLSSTFIALGWSLPQDWFVVDVIQTGVTLSLTVAPKDGARQSSFNAWRDTLPGEISVTPVDRNYMVSINIDSEAQAKLYVAGHFPQRFHDDLVGFGAKELSFIETPASNDTREWTYQFKLPATNINTLALLSEITQKKPLFISHLKLSPLTPPLVDVTMTLTLIGQ